ncbi:MAG: CDGSH iron-sulfur domain-containing protein [Myxococcota bacterium]
MSTKITLRPRGPLMVEGDFTIVGEQGEVVRRCESGRVALCRCGATRAQPFCDSSHHRVDFGAAVPARTDGEER